MKEEEILNTIKELGKGQGFYSRLYQTLIELKENDITSYKQVMDNLEKQNFSDTLDLVMYIEN